MNRRRLPYSVLIEYKECEIDPDYRNILDIFVILNDPDLLEQEKVSLALQYFYTTDDYKVDIETAIKYMMDFIAGGECDTTPSDTHEKPLYDWEQDFDIIVAPINKIIGHDIRMDEELHWWTFLSAFMEIGECTFSTFVSIRNKKNKGKKLDKAEEQIYRDNKNRINLKKKYDKTTQALMDEILGIG